MANLYPVAGSKIFIGSAANLKPEVTVSDFAGANWTEIDGWANMGDLGDTQNFGDQELINTRRVISVKTTRDGGTMTNQFVPMGLDPGQLAFEAAMDDCRPYQFKVERGADCAPESEVTITIADPGVVTWANHGLVAGSPVVFTAGDGGALPTGLSAGTVYYVIAAGLTTDTFSVSATAGGSGIETTGTVTSPVIASAPPVGMTQMFLGYAAPGPSTGGGASDIYLQSYDIRVTSNIVKI